MERKERAWEERLRAAAGKREREREAETTPPLLPILSLSVDLCAFHAETVEKGRERERERDAVAVGKVVLCARAREGGDRRALRGGYGFLTDAPKALAHHIETVETKFSSN